MNAQEIISYISESKKKTPVKLYVMEQPEASIDYGLARVFSDGRFKVVFGEWSELKEVLSRNAAALADVEIESDRRNSALPLLDIKQVNARIEPGAIIREQVEIGDNAVIMMGAILNIGASVGTGTMIDMGAILGGRASVGSHSHVGAGAVLAGVIEPASAQPVRVGDNVLIGANAVVLEGVQIGDDSVVAAGAVVIDDVPAGSVVAGIPARVIKQKSETASDKVALIDALRKL